MMIPDHVRVELVTRREVIGLTRRVLAELIPCHPNTLYCWEAGWHSPSAQSLDRWRQTIDDAERRLLQLLVARHGVPA